MSRIKVIAIALGAVLVSNANAACPATECNYLDPQFMADLKKWTDCSFEYTNAITKAVQSLAILYPRFGIAYSAYMDEVNEIVHRDGPTDWTAAKVAKQRFDDRILQTAEPEALTQYNFIQMTAKQHPPEEKCGTMPEPPKKQP